MSSTHFGKYANNVKTLLIHAPVQLLPGDPLEFTEHILNVANFPHKNRCMIMIDTLSITALNDVNTDDVNRNNFAEQFPELFSLPIVGVSADGLGVQNSYDTISNQNSFIGIS